jgi:hypothetical protein
VTAHTDNGDGYRLEAGAPTADGCRLGDGAPTADGCGQDARGPSHGTTRRELTWVLLWAAFVMLLTCIPYGYAVQRADGRRFSGFIWGVDEGNVYLTWMRQAAEGDLFFRNQYSTEPERPRFVNAFLQLGGRAADLLHVDQRVMFHVLRLLGGMFLLVAFHLLVAALTPNRVARWAALVLASLGSGLGWLVVLLVPQSGLHPVDVGQAWQTQPEAVTFLSLLLNGLFTTSMALMCLTFLFALRALQGDRRAVWWAGLCLLVLGNVHTYDVFAVWIVLGLTAVWRDGAMARWRDGVKRLGLIVAIGLPSVLWSLYATFTDPSFLAKGLTPTPAFRFIDYAVAYGLIGLLAVAGAVLAFSRHPAISPSRLPIVWSFANAFVLLIPVSFQRKMIEGLHLPLCILAGFAVSWLAQQITRGLRARGKHKQAAERVVLTVCVAAVLCLPSNALFVSQCLDSVKTNNAELLAVLQPPIYLDPGDAAALEWLAANATREDVILSSSLVGSTIPTVCPAKVWIGHWAETLHFREHLQTAMHLYAAPTPSALRETGVTLLYASRWEAAMARTELNPSGLPLVYDEQGVRLYRVPPVSP